MTTSEDEINRPPSSDTQRDTQMEATVGVVPEHRAEQPEPSQHRPGQQQLFQHRRKQAQPSEHPLVYSWFWKGDDNNSESGVQQQETGTSEVIVQTWDTRGYFVTSQGF
jgi:hypothetical protein